MRLTESESRQRFSQARVAHLSTVSSEGVPHLVPVTFAVRSSSIFIAVDSKPKQSRDLRRVRNIEENPSVCLLVDHFAEDWTQLWWVRADGVALILRADDMRAPIDLLVDKYPQYRDSRPAGPVIRVDVNRWSGWSFLDPS